MLKSPEIEKMRPLSIPRTRKEQLLLIKKEEKQRKKLEKRKNNHKEKLGPYRLFLIGDEVFRQDEFPGNKVPANIREIGREI